MTQQCTYGQLSRILNDLEREVAIHPIFELFNREKIRRFYQQNAMRIGVFNDRRNLMNW